MNLKEILKKLRDQIKALAEKEKLTEQEGKELEDLMSQATRVKAQIAAHEEIEEAEKEEQEASEAARKAEVDEAVKKAEERWKTKAAEGNRLPSDKEAPYVLSLIHI